MISLPYVLGRSKELNKPIRTLFTQLIMVQALPYTLSRKTNKVTCSVINVLMLCNKRTKRKCHISDNVYTTSI